MSLDPPIDQAYEVAVIHPGKKSGCGVHFINEELFADYNLLLDGVGSELVSIRRILVTYYFQKQLATENDRQAICNRQL
jgi:hypothetical protein